MSTPRREEFREQPAPQSGVATVGRASGPAAALVLALVTTVAPVAAPGAGSQAFGSTQSPAASHSVWTKPILARPVGPIGRADTALRQAVSSLHAHHYVRTRASLRMVGIQTGKAHVAATALIGAPPTDPESDEAPGPPAVLATLSLDHRIGMRLTGAFQGVRRVAVIGALRQTLSSTHHRRDVILDRLIALPVEGARADYEDGMADTLGTYDQERRAIAAALRTHRLSRPGTVALRHALARIRATSKKVNRAFGGGE
jgi:hypothetical protein